MRKLLCALATVAFMAGLVVAAEVTVVKYDKDKNEITVKEGEKEATYKLTDKVKKLRKTMWDAEIIREARNLGITADNGDLQQLRFEDTEEILMDVIGHCALAISILRDREEERKRDNENIRERLSGSLSDTPVGQVGLF